MSYSLIGMIPWLFVTIVVFSLNLISALILLKERHLGSWMMLAGCGIMLLGQLGNFAMQVGMMMGRDPTPSLPYIIGCSALGSLGSVLFAAGLLLHALRQNAKANRVAELETIIASMQNR